MASTSNVFQQENQKEPCSKRLRHWCVSYGSIALVVSGYCVAAITQQLLGDTVSDLQMNGYR